MSTSAKKIRPKQHLWRVEKQFPEAFRHIEEFRMAKGANDFKDWPDWCYVPAAGAYAIVSKGVNRITNQEALSAVAAISSLGAWRIGQSVYRFDQDLFKSLINTPVGKVPVESLYRLPEYGLYIETPSVAINNEQIHGFFVHLEYDINTGRPELRLLLDFKEALLSYPLHMTVNTVEEMLLAMLAESRKHSEINDLALLNPSRSDIEAVTNLLSRLISLALYLCSDNPDYGDQPAPKRPREKMKRLGATFKIPKHPEIREIGYRVGKNIRAAREANQGAGLGERTVSPHIRNAHWHSFWLGPRDGDRELHVKWLPPILVKIDSSGGMPITIKKVKS